MPKVVTNGLGLHVILAVCHLCYCCRVLYVYKSMSFICAIFPSEKKQKNFLVARKKRSGLNFVVVAVCIFCLTC
jgi:hypothetical protein